MAKDTNKDNNKETKHIIDKQEAGSNGIAGTIEMSQDVVETIAGLAAGRIDGIHRLGKSRIVQFGEDPKHGISAEVGQKEAALDLDVVIDYDCNIREVAKTLRKQVAEEVERMAGRKVIEINLNVIGIHLEGEEEPKEVISRVQ